MSRSRILPSFSSSRQMMMAWKVSGLSHSPAIIASRPASMRLAMAISPSRERSSTEPISRKYMRTGSSVRSDGSALVSTFGDRGDGGDRARGGLDGVGAFRRLLGLVGVDDVDAHVGKHRHGVLDLLGGDLLGGQHLVQLVIGDEAARLRGLDQLLDGCVRHVEHGTVRELPPAAALDPLRQRSWLPFIYSEAGPDRSPDALRSLCAIHWAISDDHR